MPKNKTHSGAKKRFKTTGGGKIMHVQTNRRHLAEYKSSRRMRRLAVEGETAKADRKSVRRMLGK